MVKNYNLVIDTKRNFFNPIRGLKQGDNNSILNITLIQNSLAYDLTGCTVRINYKLRNGQTLLQMADIVEARTGKIKINILTKALIFAGEVKADISVFDSNNRKITTATMSLFIDTSIYTNDYLENQELDIIQGIYVSENERLVAEAGRKDAEYLRVDAEKLRINNENIRKSNENQRIENEKNRTNKWNELKSHAESNNIKQDKEIETITNLNETMKGEHTSRTTEYNDLKKIILDENSSATLLEKNKNTNERIDKNINRIDNLNKSTKIAVENPIIVERNSIGLNPLDSLNYVGGDTFQANEPITIDSGILELNYNSEVELVNNKNIRYVPAKNKVIENEDSIKSLLEKINKLEEKVKSLESVNKKIIK